MSDWLGDWEHYKFDPDQSSFSFLHVVWEGGLSIMATEVLSGMLAVLMLM